MTKRALELHKEVFVIKAEDSVEKVVATVNEHLPEGYRASHSYAREGTRLEIGNRWGGCKKAIPMPVGATNFYITILLEIEDNIGEYEEDEWRDET